MAFVNGVEISIEWEALQIHILGFAFDSADPVLNDGLATIRSGRIERARRMSAALEKVGIAGAFEGAMRYAANPSLVSRAHFGRYLVESGVCKDLRSVFESYLVPGRPGYVDHRWATLADSLRWILGAGGIAAVAHPGRYKLSRAEMRRFLGDFKDLGRAGDRGHVGQSHAGACGGFRSPGQGIRFSGVARLRFSRAGRELCRSGQTGAAAGGLEARLAAGSELGGTRHGYSTSRFIPTIRRQRLLQKAAEVVRQGGVIALPTDSSYALGCHLGDKAAVERIRSLRGVDDRHHLTLMCRDLSQIGQFARVDNARYRLLKATTPGSYTFILEGTRELPRRVLHPKGARPSGCAFRRTRSRWPARGAWRAVADLDADRRR
jgi:hypothetical protein